MGQSSHGFEDRMVAYPIRTIFLPKIQEIASAAGFELLLRSPEPQAFYDRAVTSELLIYVHTAKHV